jgi:hypothetical protein
MKTTRRKMPVKDSNRKIDFETMSKGVIPGGGFDLSATIDK